MKRIVSILLCLVLLMNAVPFTVFASEEQQAAVKTEGVTEEDLAGEDEKLGWGIDHVYATFLDETKDVSREVMEIDGGYGEPIHVKVDYTDYVDLVFSIVQMKGKEIKEVARTDGTEMTFTADSLTKDWPLYLNVFAREDHRHLGSEVLGFRVNQSPVLAKVPARISSEFGNGFMVDMSDFLPGMELDVLPFLIPITAKTYADGKIRLGIGLNSSDAQFWAKAANGEMPEQKMVNDLEKVFKGESKYLDGVKGKSMGLVVIFNGWAEGDLYKENSPITGHMELYIGTGFDVTGQYAIFTWEIMLMGGAQGLFDFSYKYESEDGNYHFSADEIRLGVKGGLEVYGGIGVSLASVGVYGAGSVAYQSTIYPDAEMEHLIVAGELGLKAKLFGKTLCCFKIIAGSHDFVNDKSKPKTFLAMGEHAEETKEYLLSNDYGGKVGVLTESGTLTWYGDNVEDITSSNDAAGSDLAHLLATDIYPDNHVQIANVGGSAIPMMGITFLGADNTRAKGNRSILMSSYYNESTQFICDPAPIADDGTADFSPCLFNVPNGATYVVWQNADTALEENMTFSQIAEHLDLAFSEYQTGNSWYKAEKVTDYAGTGFFPAGAVIGASPNGSPIIAYYLNDVNDPAGLDGTHEVYIASRSSTGKWTSEKVTEVDGQISRLDVALFGGLTTVAVSLEKGEKRTVSLWRNGAKIWEKENASAGIFLRGGNNYKYLTWFQDARVYQMDESSHESPLTTEDINVPDQDYEIYGQLGSSAVLLVGTAGADTSADAFAYISSNGGTTWAKAELTKIGGNALVSHISAAFNTKDEPVLVYSVQNYTVNVDLDGLLEDPIAAAEKDDGTNGAEILLGEEDERFTDTSADLYIKVKTANRHVALTYGIATDIDQNEPGKDAPVTLTVTNNGLYPVEKVSIVNQGKVIASVKKTIGLGESLEIPVKVKLPGGDIYDTLYYTFEAVTRDDKVPDDEISVPIDPGYFTAQIWHALEHGQEMMRYKITNYGYTNKTAHIILRDDARGVTLQDYNVTVYGGATRESYVDADHETFAQDGCQDVTLYVLMEGEKPGDPEISNNRVKSIRPLNELYGQPFPVIGESTENSNEVHRGYAWVWITAGVIVCAAAASVSVIVIRRKKKKAE